MKRQLSIGVTLFFAIALGLAMSACKKQELVPNDTDLSGVYTLVSVNGNSVPASVSHEGVAVQVRSGTFTIKADGTCSCRTVFVPQSRVEVAREVAARYTRNGSRLTMQWEGAGITVGTIQGDTFTMDNEGMVFVYKKG